MQKYGRYEVTELIGKGSMGAVYKGWDPNAHRQVAIKVIDVDDPEMASQIDSFRRRFLHETEIMARLIHPNIVILFDSGTEQGQPYMVMEYIDGQSLLELVSAGEKLSLQQVMTIFSNLTDALEFAHKKQIVHRDLKPDNLMITREGNAKLMDFGIAKAFNIKKNKTQGILGTPQYISPEQLRGEDVDRRADVFSMGNLTHFLLTGKSAFDGENVERIFFRIVMGQPEILPCHEHLGLDNAALRRVFLKVFNKDADQRYQTAREFFDDFVKNISYDFHQKKIVARRAAPAPQPAKVANVVLQGPATKAKKGSGNKGLFVAAAGLMTVLAALVVLMVMRGNQQPEVVEPTAGETPVTQVAMDMNRDRPQADASGSPPPVEVPEETIEQAQDQPETSTGDEPQEIPEAPVASPADTVTPEPKPAVVLAKKAETTPIAKPEQKRIEQPTETRINQPKPDVAKTAPARQQPPASKAQPETNTIQKPVPEVDKPAPVVKKPAPERKETQEAVAEVVPEPQPVKNEPAPETTPPPQTAQVVASPKPDIKPASDRNLMPPETAQNEAKEKAMPLLPDDMIKKYSHKVRKSHRMGKDLKIKLELRPKADVEFEVIRIKWWFGNDLSRANSNVMQKKGRYYIASIPKEALVKGNLSYEFEATVKNQETYLVKNQKAPYVTSVEDRPAHISTF